MCIHPQHDYTQATLECVLILGVLFCVWSFLRVHKKRKKKEKKRNEFFLTEEFTTQYYYY